ncbi:Envelysin, partial [Bertholletia excelsa]
YVTITLFSIFLVQSPACISARTVPDQPTETTVDETPTSTWHDFVKFVDTDRGSHLSGISELKKYFRRFGYLEPGPDTTLSDTFDEGLESAVVAYQEKLGLKVTGKLDASTVAAMMSPRCGVSDAGAWSLQGTRRYAYFPGEPRWVRQPPMTLTYAFSPHDTIAYLAQSDIKAVFERSFSRWSAAIPLNFAEVEDYSAADIKIGFFHGDHGDGEPFDGVLGILAHAFSPENGRFHMDAAERWAVDFRSERSKVAVDLESVATHEVGHVLGLAHTSVKEAIMYPSLSPRTRKVDLRRDDVEGVQALYGANPNYKFSSPLKSDGSLSRAVGLGAGWSMWAMPWVMIILTL